MLKEIRVIGIKSFKNVQIGFKQVNIIVNSNVNQRPVGCTNFTSIFNALGFLCTKSFALYIANTKTHNFLHLGVSKTNKAKISMLYQNAENINKYDLNLWRDGEMLNCVEYASYHNQNEFDNPEIKKIGIGTSDFCCESSLHEDKSQLSKYTLRLLSSIQYYNPNFNSDSVIRFANKATNKKYITLKSNFSNLAECINILSVEYPEYLTTINSIFEKYGFTIITDWRNGKICLNANIKNSPTKYVTPYYLTDKQLKFISLVSLLACPIQELQDIIVIEDIDSGLTESQLNIIADLLQNVSKQSQFIITASSKFVELCAQKAISTNVIEFDWDEENCCTIVNSTDMMNHTTPENQIKIKLDGKENEKENG